MVRLSTKATSPALAILPNEDEDISEMAKSIFMMKGIKFLNNASVVSINNSENGITSNIKIGNQEEKLKSEKILIAIGITGNTENLGLGKTNVEVVNCLLYTSPSPRDQRG